jgi:hypothetical protein
LKELIRNFLFLFLLIFFTFIFIFYFLFFFSLGSTGGQSWQYCKPAHAPLGQGPSENGNLPPQSFNNGKARWLNG